MMMTVMAADPGKRGALAWGTISPGLERAEFSGVDVVDMPLVVRQKGEDSQVSEVYGPDVFRLMTTVRPGLFVSEFLTPRPPIARRGGSGVRTGGAKQEWALGKGFGGLCSAAQCWFIANDMPPGVHLVRPDVWKKAMGLTSDKNLSLDAARERFPDMAMKLKRKMDEGRAEALMILAYYGDHVYHRTNSGIDVI